MMGLMKKKISVNKDGAIEARHVIAVIEDFQSHMQGVAEGVIALNEKVDKLDRRLGKAEQDMEIVKGELSIIRHHQVTRDEFKLLESRVLKLEQRVK
jgi:hypothetical protein